MKTSRTASPTVRMAALLASITAAILTACGPAAVPEPPPTAATAQELPGICARTPEVQVAIIRELARHGPRMGCASIVAGEMHRLRSLSLVTPHLTPGDLHGMPNATSMDITLEQSWPAPGSLDGPRELEELRIRLTGPRRDWHVEPGAFRLMSNLVRLEINGRTTVRIHLENGSLAGLDNLRELRVDSLEHVEPEALRALPQLRRLELRASFRQPSQRNTEPMLPAELVQDAARLEHAELSNFREK